MTAPTAPGGDDLTDRRQCKAVAKRTGKRCGAYAIRGAEVCRVHGGMAPQVRAAAARRLAEDRLRRRLDQAEIREVADPIGEFQRMVAEALALKDMLASHVASLDALRFTDARGSEQLRAEVALYERAMDRSARFLETWVKLGMEERLVRVTEVQAAAMGAALDRALTAAGIDGERRREVVAALASELRGE